ncbi:unnamed protein product [Pedinophyceae sp. YPF-701]|nr:unnamed protein product [Pedinophyceae sp. YPF-701]
MRTSIGPRRTTRVVRRAACVALLGLCAVMFALIPTRSSANHRSLSSFLGLQANPVWESQLLVRGDLEGYALLLAGEVRTFVLPGAAERWMKIVVDPLDADVFMNVALEANTQMSPHNGGKPPPPHERYTRSREQLDVAVRPFGDKLRNLTVASDAELEGDPWWRGEAVTFPGLHFRQAKLLHAMRHQERARGRPYAWVIRTRPDLYMDCTLPPPAEWPHPWDRSVEGMFGLYYDFIAVLPRAAAELALNAYFIGHGFVGCLPFQDAPETCVPHLLRQHGWLIRGLQWSKFDRDSPHNGFPTPRRSHECDPDMHPDGPECQNSHQVLLDWSAEPPKCSDAEGWEPGVVFSTHNAEEFMWRLQGPPEAHQISRLFALPETSSDAKQALVRDSLRDATRFMPPPG